MSRIKISLDYNYLEMLSDPCRHKIEKQELQDDSHEG